MYRVITNFSIDNTEYLVGDMIALEHNDQILNNPHYRQFVVPLVAPTPQTITQD